jgi:hypothetical protein
LKRMIPMTRRSKSAPPARLRYVEENGEVVLHCEFDGKIIAKRYSQQNWISLEPGFVVRGSEPGGDYSSISIEYDPSRARQQ